MLQTIAYVMVVGVASATAVPKVLASINASRLDFDAETLAADVRHAQALARGWGRALVLDTAPSSYSVTCATRTDGPCTSAAQPVLDPARAGSFSAALPSGVTLSSSLPGSAKLSFDASGRPSAAVTYTLSATGATRRVLVSAETGRVTLQ